MQWASPAKRHQRELPGVVPAFDRNYANGLLHLRFHHAQYACGELLGCLERSLLFVHDLLHPLPIELHSAAQKAALVQPAQQQVRVGNGGQDSPAKTNWTWI